MVANEYTSDPDFSARRPLHQRVMRRAFEVLWVMCDPHQFAVTQTERAHSELEARIRFNLVRDVNAPSQTAFSRPNNFTDEERKKWFGKEKVTRHDITWDVIDRILCPSAMPNALTRSDGETAGQGYRRRHFSRADHRGTGRDPDDPTEMRFTPQTVAIYDSEEHAAVAAKLLKMMTAGSGASIALQPLEGFDRKPAWAVVDNMNLATHKALCLVMWHLAEGKSEDEIERQRIQAQQEINVRLPPNETLTAKPRVGAYLMLAGRHGVKKYRQDEHGHDDPEDIERLEILDYQDTPDLIAGVPRASTMRRDGRPVEADTRLAEVMYLLLGHEMSDVVMEPSWHHIKRAFGEKANEAQQLLTKGAAFEVGETVTNIAMHGIIHEAICKAGGAAFAAAAGLGMLITAPIYHGIKKMGYDPVNNELRALAEKHTGGSFTKAQFGRTWEPRHVNSGVATRDREQISDAYNNATMEEIPGARHGEVTLNTHHESFDLHAPKADILHWQKRMERRDEFGKLFAKHIHDHKGWKALDRELSGLAQHDGYRAAREELAESFAEFVLLSADRAQSRNYSVSASSPIAQPDHTQKIIGRYMEAAENFVNVMHREVPRLNHELAIKAIADTREAMIASMQQFLHRREISAAVVG